MATFLIERCANTAVEDEVKRCTWVIQKHHQIKGRVSILGSEVDVSTLTQQILNDVNIPGTENQGAFSGENTIFSKRLPDNTPIPIICPKSEDQKAYTSPENSTSSPMFAKLLGKKFWF